MKVKLLLFSLLLPFRVAFAQEYQTVDSANMVFKYEYHYLQDSTKLNQKSIELMTLRIGKSYSLFSHPTIIFVDSVFSSSGGADGMVALEKVLPIIQSNSASPMSNYSIFKNYPKKGVLTFNSTVKSDENYQVVDKFLFKWVLVPKRDTVILGYTCKMATTVFRGRTYTAWYTPKIPISDGPYKFAGLPGLILQVGSNDKQHLFKLSQAQIYKKPIPIIYKSESYKTVSPEGYIRAIKAINDEFYNRVQSDDKFMNLNSESRAKLLANLKKRNNFIEKF